MLQSATLRNDLESKSDIKWFDAICNFLKRSEHSTTHQLTQLIGSEKPNPNNEDRGSKFLIPYDKRFVFACINPNLLPNDTDKPIEYFAIGGKDFSLPMSDLLLRFPEYKTQRDTYDGGTQIFFYPVPKEYEFSALSFDIDKEPEEIENIAALIFHSVTFKFGDKLLLGRDGYHMRR
jgi:hypothetical protein